MSHTITDQPLLRAQGLTVQYGSKRAVDNLSFDIPKGRVVGLLGHNGAGKTSLLKAIVGLIAGQGSLSVLGLDPRAQRVELLQSLAYIPDVAILPRWARVSELVDLMSGLHPRFSAERARTLLRRQHIGFVFQHFNLIPVMTVADNVDYPLLLNGLPDTERQQRVARILEQVGLSGLADRLPDQLSGGQRQRVAIARALVKGPSLVIADEPTANLDSTTAGQIIDLMKHMAAQHQVTFLIATHDDRMTAHCDRIYCLADGVLA